MEFVDAQRVANNSPPCTFTPDPPLEVRSMPGASGSKPVGYLSLGKPLYPLLKNLELCRRPSMGIDHSRLSLTSFGLPLVENRFGSSTLLSVDPPVAEASFASFYVFDSVS